MEGSSLLDERHKVFPAIGSFDLVVVSFRTSSCGCSSSFIWSYDGEIRLLLSMNDVDVEGV